MKPQPRYQPGDKIGGRYQVHKALMGGMGEVYLCLDLEEMYPYALKTFQQRYLTDPQRLRKAFEKEVATWVALEKHPNIVRCFYMESLDNQPFMVIEWVAGEEGRGTDLRGWLRRGPLDLKLAMEVTIDICHGLMHAQAKRLGLVHCDLKPENILMAQGGLAKITDFGLAQIMAEAGLEVGQESNTTNQRQSFIGKQGIAGTPAYMAPEQWRGEALDERTDFYALGCILYEMLTGTSPYQVNFTPTTPQSFQVWLRTMQSAHERGQVATLPTTLPAVLNDLLQRCLAKAPQERPANLSALLAWLTTIYQAQFSHPLPPRPVAGDFTAGDYNSRGNTYDELHRYEEALADYGHAIQLEPDSASVYANRGVTYSKLRRYEEALADQNYAIHLLSTSAFAHVSRGTTFLKMQRYEEALTDFNLAIQLDRFYLEAYVNRGITYHRMYRYEEALADFNYAVRLNPVLAVIYKNRGVTYQALGCHQEALADCIYAIQLDPSDAETYTNCGLTYRALERYEEALAEHTKAISLNETLTSAYTNRGDTYGEMQRYNEALADYSFAIQLDSSDERAYYNRGNVFIQLQRHDKALSDYTQAISLSSTFALAYMNRGNTYDELQRYDEALADYNRAIKLDPKFVYAFTGRGITYGKLQHYEESLIDFTRALDIDPACALAYRGRGTTYFYLERYSEALEDLKRSIQINDNDALAFFNIGRIFHDRGSLTRALPYFEKATQLGFIQGKQYVEQIKQYLQMHTTWQVHPIQRALEAFHWANSEYEMQQVIARFPFMLGAEFIGVVKQALEQATAQQAPSTYRYAFEQRLGWLFQIAYEQETK